MDKISGGHLTSLPSVDVGVRIRDGLEHYSCMEPPTIVLCASGISVLACALIVVRVIVGVSSLRTPTEPQQAGDGHERAAIRDDVWYGLDDPIRIDRSPFEKPLS